MKMSKWQGAVAEFHREVMDKDPSRKVPIKTIGLHEPVLRASLLLEEVAEFIIALYNQDFVEAVDGIIDIFYIGLGSCDRWGADTTLLMNDLIAQKERNTERSKHQGVLVFSKTSKMCSEMIFENAIKAVQNTLKKKDMPYCVSSIFCLFEELLILADMWGVDLEPFFAEVHRTNMLKGGGKFDSLGKLLKPEGWEPPRIKELLDAQGLL